jgi:hypothetical protein
MNHYSANLPKRIGVAVAWSILIFALVVGRRLFHALDNPDYSVPWFGYAIGAGIPFILMILPSILTAASIEFTADRTILRYIGRGERSFVRTSLKIKAKNKRSILIQGETNGGQFRKAFLLSSGFGNSQWNEIASLLEDAKSTAKPNEAEHVVGGNGA